MRELPTTMSSNNTKTHSDYSVNPSASTTERPRYSGSVIIEAAICAAEKSHNYEAPYGSDNS